MSAWTIFRQSARKASSTDQKLQAAQSVLLLSLYMEKDLDALYEDPTHLIEFTIDPGTSHLSFYRFGSKSAEGTWEPLPLEKVEYTFNGQLGKVFRKYQGKTRHFLGSYERLNYRLADPAPNTSPDLLSEAPSILISIVGLSDEALARQEDKREPSQRSVLVNGLPRHRVAAMNAYSSWNPVPYGPPAS
jgi:hypothetical protein